MNCLSSLSLSHSQYYGSKLCQLPMFSISIRKRIHTNITEQINRNKPAELGNTITACSNLMFYSVDLNKIVRHIWWWRWLYKMICHRMATDVMHIPLFSFLFFSLDVQPSLLLVDFKRAPVCVFIVAWFYLYCEWVYFGCACFRFHCFPYAFMVKNIAIKITYARNLTLHCY